MTPQHSGTVLELRGVGVNFGGLVALVLAVNYTVFPVVSTFTYTDQTTSLSYGWEEVIPEVEKALAERKIGFIATGVDGAAISRISMRPASYAAW